MKVIFTLVAVVALGLGAALIAEDAPAVSPTADFGKPPKPAEPVAPKLDAGQKWIFAFGNFAKDDRTTELTDLVKPAARPATTEFSSAIPSLKSSSSPTTSIRSGSRRSARCARTKA